ncbi:MAG TPA: ABC transporter permease [Terriglobia bacterium]|nr:ABC transporter permease [Terriglobia bacterium]
MKNFLQDLKYGLRMLAKSPAFTVVAVLTLGLGIGANTAIFTIFNAVLLNPLPVKDASRLFELDTTDKKTLLALGNTTKLGVSFPNYQDYAQQASVFSGLAAFSGPLPLTLSGGEKPKQYQGSLVTANYFDVLGVHALLGRTFRPDEDQHPGGDSVAVISYGFWSREFGGAHDALGRTLALNGNSYTVIGVTPPQFKGTFLFASSDQIWIPASMHSRVLDGFFEANFKDRRFLDFTSFGRLKPGVSVHEADTAVGTIASRLEQQYPKDNAGRGATLSPIADAALGINQHDQIAKAGGVLLGIVGLVLLIACVNIANLLLAQTARREKEMCLRAALGAGSGRLVRQSLTESFLLSILGGASGLLIGYWGRSVLWSYRPTFLQRSHIPLPLDGRVLAFTFGISILTAILFGLVPAFKASRPNLVETLNAGGRSGSMAWGRNRFRQALVVSEVSLALITLIGAGLFLRSLSYAESLNPGFESKKLFVMGFDLGSQHYDEDRGEQYFRDAIERAASVPGVQSVAVASSFPMGGGLARTIFLEGQDEKSGQQGTLTALDNISPGFFQTEGIPLLKGRAFTDLDRKGTKPVAMVNRAMARHFWPGENPLGKRFHFFGDPMLLEVVGEVADSWQFGVGEDPQPVAYLSMAQYYASFGVLHVRTSGNPGAVISSVREQVQSLDRNLALVNVNTIGELLDQGLWAPRMGAILLGVFGMLALVLASVGIYGVLSYSVSQRIQEVGIRMALGATPLQVLGLVLKQGMALVAIGVAIGLAGSFGLARLLASLLFGVHASDPVTFVGVSLVLGVVALIATYIPARRATKVNPMVALRYQ